MLCIAFFAYFYLDIFEKVYIFACLKIAQCLNIIYAMSNIYKAPDIQFVELDLSNIISTSGENAEIGINDDDVNNSEKAHRRGNSLWND